MRDPQYTPHAQALLRRFKRAAADLHRAHDLRGRADVLWERAKVGLGVEGCGISYSTGTRQTEDGENPTVTVAMPLAEYLATWPNEEPNQRTWECDGKTRASMYYPYKLVGYAGKLEVWCYASTRSVLIEDAKKERGAA